uniref:Putative group v salivary lipocalin n=1 Tax=Rhipicephalus pulchellus TaxID=72859 RepID=L7MBS3_RHIPC
MYALQGFLMIVATTLFPEFKAESEVSLRTDQLQRIIGVFNTSARLWLYQVNYTILTETTTTTTTATTTTTTATSNSSNTSVKAVGTCIFLKKHNITEKDYYFWMNESYVKGRWLSSPLHGTFRIGGNLGAMNVSYIEEPWSDGIGNDSSEGDYFGEESLEYPLEEMELKYTDANCSVFLVHSFGSSGKVCRLYVLDEAVSQGPTADCSDYFNKTCNGTRGVLYNETCRL